MNYYANEEILKRKKIKEKIFEKIKLILVILISIIVIYNISLIVQGIIEPDKTPACFGVKTFAIVSGSMMPEINAGDIVIVKDVNEEELQEGDIISFRKNAEIITHRIERIEIQDNEKRYITKGDNNNTVDAMYVSFENIEGRVENIIPYLGNVVIFLKNKITIAVILLIYVVIYVYDTKKSNKKMMRKKKRELLNEKRKELE